MAKSILLLERFNPQFLPIPGNWQVFQSSIPIYDKGEIQETRKLFVASDGARVVREWSEQEILAKALKADNLLAVSVAEAVKFM